MKQIGEKFTCIFVSILLMCTLFFKEERAGSKIFWVAVLSSIVAVALEEWRIYIIKKRKNKIH